jgi:hypothetical protein
MLGGGTMNDEVVEKVVVFSVTVLTNKGREKTIRISDIRYHIGSSLAIYNDDDDICKIEFKMDCIGYTKEII